MDEDAAIAQYWVYRSAIHEETKAQSLWVLRKRAICRLRHTGCGRRMEEVAELYERTVRDLPWSEYVMVWRGTKERDTDEFLEKPLSRFE